MAGPTAPWSDPWQRIAARWIIASFSINHAAPVTITASRFAFSHDAGTSSSRATVALPRCTAWLCFGTKRSYPSDASVSEDELQLVSLFHAIVSAIMVHTADKPFSKATTALFESWRWLVSAAQALRTAKAVSPKSILKRGHNCVVVWNDFVVKVPDQSSILFDREVRAIESAAFARTMGFVDASVVDVTPELRAKLPRQVRGATKAILMPRLPGTNAVDANLNFLDPDIIATSVIDSHCRLIDRGWYNTDCKLDNIQLIPGGVKLLDWGSLCPADAVDPTFTFSVKGQMSSPHVCMSVNLVVTLLELYGNYPPEDTVLDVETYGALRKQVLEVLKVPLRDRLAKILAAPA